ncbi:hypothetical protein BO71DRAFT_127181 [Aspergillus ellipticus CBS 707.79]|uniref:Uncharacterized protein n=1 Tax=Aspergillus ellipticus CBS 707.79 TaxID=1448320 RepID=A0A319CUE7_9EURO|nr:hypothetical protein BO71DRAFT_127181 [Aspergillus ellipticus CBS 707.79]
MLVDSAVGGMWTMARRTSGCHFLRHQSASCRLCNSVTCPQRLRPPGAAPGTQAADHGQTIAPFGTRHSCHLQTPSTLSISIGPLTHGYQSCSLMVDAPQSIPDRSQQMQLAPPSPMIRGPHPQAPLTALTGSARRVSTRLSSQGCEAARVVWG